MRNKLLPKTIFGTMLIILSGCASSQEKADKSQVGFINSHTFRVTATGVSVAKEKDIEKRNRHWGQRYWLPAT